jgi:hypothetical protein
MSLETIMLSASNHDSVYMRCLVEANPWRQRVDQWLLRAENYRSRKEQGGLLMVQGFFFG